MHIYFGRWLDEKNQQEKRWWVWGYQVASVKTRGCLKTSITVASVPLLPRIFPRLLRNQSAPRRVLNNEYHDSSYSSNKIEDGINGILLRDCLYMIFPEAMVMWGSSRPISLMFLLQPWLKGAVGCSVPLYHVHWWPSLFAFHSNLPWSLVALIVCRCDPIRSLAELGFAAGDV